ncbi:MAG: hypothetical protein Q9191_002953 [Dirinaria sp. TL-2023a]
MDDPLPPDPYKALGIAKDAPLAAVRSAHRKLVLLCHPDKVTDEAAKKTAADKFHLVQQAYEILSDESKRQRYDERVKLADLRAEMGKDKMGSRIVPEFTPRGTSKPAFEMRGNAAYEEIRPRRTYEEDDYFQPRYQEVRPRNTDRSFVQPPRRTSGRGSEDRRRARELAREIEEERDRERRRKDAVRAEEKAARSERNKRRDKDKRRDYETKSRSKYAAYVDDESDSDSDYTERVYARREEPPKRRYEEDLRKRDREIPIRSSKRDDYSSYDDYDSKHVRAQDFAQDYIAKSRSSIETEPRRPPTYTRSFSHVEPRSVQPPPPPPVVPDLKRAAGRGHPRREPSPPPRLSKKDRRKTDINIVDPPSNARRASEREPFIIPSDPNGSKAFVNPRRGPPRAHTLEHTPEPKHPSLMRSGTEPIDRSRLGDKVPLSGRAKEQHDSGYSSRSSRGTPDLSPSESPQLKSTRWRIQEDSDDSEDEITIVPEPDGGYHRVREVSPKARRPPTTPHSASTMRMPPMRSGSSYTVPLEQPPTPRTAPAFIRTESGRPAQMKSRPSARGAPPLYGEVQHPEEPYRVVNQSPRLKTEDGKHVNYSPRRGSEDMDRDAYPGSHHRPGFARHESRAVRT